jgi:hypothetical protein
MFSCKNKNYQTNPFQEPAVALPINDLRTIFSAHASKNEPIFTTPCPIRHSSFVIRSSELGIWNFPPPVTQLSQPANCRNEILPVSVQSRIGTEFNEQIFCQLMPCRQEI